MLKSRCPIIFAVAFDTYDRSHMRASAKKTTDMPAGAQLDLEEAFGVVPKPRDVAAGAHAFRQGSATVGVFKLVSGRVRLIRSTASGAPATMHTVRPGELFAEASLFSTRYHCDAEAVEPSRLLLYPKAALLRSMQERPDLLWTFAGELAHRVQSLRTRLEVQRTRSARERVLQFLRLHSDGTGLWHQEGTLKHLADELGLTHEALYRTLADLERDEEIVRIRGGLRLGRQA